MFLMEKIKEQRLFHIFLLFLFWYLFHLSDMGLVLIIHIMNSIIMPLKTEQKSINILNLFFIGSLEVCFILN